MTTDLFAGVPVTDFPVSLAWYEQLLGSPPTFFATEIEAVWELAEHQWIYVVQRPEHAGHAMLTLLIEDLDTRLAQIADRGLEPATREIYDDGMSKTIFHDPDGNEIGFGPPGPPED